jgi:2-oxoglutarate ferredoxin oxidoreductase subunit gamma
MVLNSVLVGFFTAATQLLERGAVHKAVEDSVPSAFRDLNLKAFEKGFEYGMRSSGGSAAAEEHQETADRCFTSR